ncbi:MAG: hypothetical protein C5B59_17240 [Bacteroidetes bacterium]|nr:MAG: hypothetical protein C5B59_17240 [Bacteroidota bacterium]
MKGSSIVHLLRQELAGHTADTEGDIIDKAVGQFYGGKLTPVEAYAVIAQISGMRKLISRMDRTIRDSGNDPEFSASEVGYQDGQAPETDPI